MRYARLGPSSVLVPVLIYPVEVLHHLLGAKDEQHVLAATAAAASSSKQQQAEGPKVLVATPWLKTGIQVAQNDRGANAHHHKQLSLRFEQSSLFYGQVTVQKWPFLGSFQDDRPENSNDHQCVKWAFAMRAAVLPWRLGYQRMANGCSIRRVPCRGATRWSILR